MHRIDEPTAVAQLPTPKQPGTPGYFTQGNLNTGQDATIVTDDWANAVQEEICTVIEAAGLVLSKTDHTQLLQAFSILTRRRLTADTTFYISPTGNDANDGLTTATPWQSIQRGLDYIRDKIDAAGHQPRLQLANGAYAGFTWDAPTPDPAPLIVGNPTDVTLVTISQNNGACCYVSNAAQLQIQALTIGGGGSAIAITAEDGGLVFPSDITFDPCSQGHIIADAFGRIVVSTGALFSIRGAAPSFLTSVTGGNVNFIGAHVDVVGTPNFSSGFAQVQANGNILSWGCTFNGPATGPHYLCNSNGVIDTHASGETYFPGSVTGTKNNNGLYL
jgi:hypothetical protein